ncbi:MAG: hypothetical protein NZ959_10975 [Armatimonadetes bacterium]|nr:hypothetical protein [Armatimonadota bacterium]MDW8122892.1 hypothetical protein [Armatimonadota bacterium]
MTGKERIFAVLEGKVPDRVPFSPNIGQWFDYHKAKNTLPEELSDCETEWEAMTALGCDIFSRRLCSPIRMVAAPYEETQQTLQPGWTRTTLTSPLGCLTSITRFDEESWTIFTVEHFIKDPDRDLAVLLWITEHSEWAFDQQGWEQATEKMGDEGVLIVPFFQSPIKFLHNWAGQELATFLLLDKEKECEELFEVFREKVFQVAQQALRSSAKVFCLMDNLDSLFHTPVLVRRYAATFYGDLADFFHSQQRYLFSHADGRLKALIPLIRDIGLDGFEGIPHPPIGDLNLDEAKNLHEGFVVVGGITAHESEATGPDAKDFIFRYCRDLFSKMRPFDRFVFSTG